MIVVLAILTLGIGVYLYIRCRTKPIEALQQVVIDEQINKSIETSIDNAANISYDNTIPVGDVEVVEEKKDDSNNFFGLAREYKNLLQKNTDQTIADLQNLRAGCAEIVQAGNRFIQAGNNRIEAGNGFIKQCDVTKAGMIETRKTIAELKSINRFQIAYYETAVKNAERNLNNSNTRT